MPDSATSYTPQAPPPPPEDPHKLRADYLRNARVSDSNADDTNLTDSELHDLLGTPRLQRIKDKIDDKIIDFLEPQDEPDVIIDKSNKRTRVADNIGKLMRLAGVVSLSVGLYGAATGVQSLRDQKQEVIKSVETLPSIKATDQAMARLLTGQLGDQTTKDVEQLNKFTEDLKMVMDTAEERATKAGEQTGSGLEEAAFGLPLAIAGHAITRKAKRKRDKASIKLTSSSDFRDILENSPGVVSRVGDDDTSESLTIKQGRIIASAHDRIVGALIPKALRLINAGLGATFAAGLLFNTSAATSVDAVVNQAYPKALSDKAIEKVVGPIYDHTRDDVIKDLRSALESNMPNTMSAIHQNPILDEKYNKILQQEIEKYTSDRPQLSGAPETSLFRSAQNQLTEYYDPLFDKTKLGYLLALSAVLLLIASKTQADYGETSIKVSQKFLDTNLAK